MYDKQVNKFKSCLYLGSLILIVILLIYYSFKSSKKLTDMDLVSGIVSEDSLPKAFWPADCIPHPCPPPERPADNSPKIVMLHKDNKNIM